jgi:cytoskeletal protein CcmA (bactofilin family)
MSGMKYEDLSINMIIGKGTIVHGDIESAGFSRIDGSIKGNLHAKGRIIIGESARIEGDISGTLITIGGVVKGDVLATERTLVLSSAVVIGDIVTRWLQVEEGCFIQGRVISCGENADWDAKVTAYLDAKSIQTLVME